MNAKQLYELRKAELDYRLFSKNNLTVLFDSKVMRFRLFNSQPTSIYELMELSSRTVNTLSK